MAITDRVSSDQCPLCRQPATSEAGSTMKIPGHSGVDIFRVKCVRCGEFSITWEALTELDALEASAAISGIAREWAELKRPLDINKDNLRSLINLAPKTLRERKQRFIKAITRIRDNYNIDVRLDFKNDFTLAYARSINEYAFIRQSLLEDGLITPPTIEDKREVFRLTAKGWEAADAIEKPAALSEKAFIAMWFNDLVQPAFHDGIAPAISETGYRPIRIDLQEHSDSVIDRIFAEIKEARFVVADFTGNRGGVYFEAGFARGLGLNVIWTCKDDHLEQLHFDVKGFNMINWKTPGELRERLNARIRAIVGYGPLYDGTTQVTRPFGLKGSDE